jgi:hypothetical protein
MFVVIFTGQAAASNVVISSSSLKFYDMNNSLFSAVALTKPTYAATIFANWSKGNQSPKSDVCDVVWSCGHRTAPIGSKSSDGTDVPTFVPLRIIAQG